MQTALVVRGFHAEVGSVAVGRPILAMVVMRLQLSAPADIGSVAPRLAPPPHSDRVHADDNPRTFTNMRLDSVDVNFRNALRCTSETSRTDGSA